MRARDQGWNYFGHGCSSEAASQQKTMFADGWGEGKLRMKGATKILCAVLIVLGVLGQSRAAMMSEAQVRLFSSCWRRVGPIWL